MSSQIVKFEDIIAWQKAQNLSLHIYNIFKKNNDFSFRDQIRRASISISNNIAEGFERRTNREFSFFLYIAKGSCGEVRSMSYMARSLGYLNENEYKLIDDLTAEISKMIYGFIKSIN